MFKSRKKKENAGKEEKSLLDKIMFWRKDTPEIKLQDIEKNIATLVKHMPQIKALLRDSEAEIDVASPNLVFGVDTAGQVIGKMYDYFINYNGSVTSGTYFSVDSDINAGNPMMMPADAPSVAADNTKADAGKIKATPKSVMHELETWPGPDMLESLEEKIKTLKDKDSLLNQRYAKDQIKGLIKRLENRRNYQLHEDFYKRFHNTTDEKIDKLLSKYLLVIKKDDLFIPTFPKEAIDVMTEYTRITKEVCGEEPVFYVIAEEKDFKKKFEKLDPILLAQSPFGFYWQILGAWDKEMLLLHEL